MIQEGGPLGRSKSGPGKLKELYQLLLHLEQIGKKRAVHGMDIEIASASKWADIFIIR
jgi:hypothetical protein